MARQHQRLARQRLGPGFLGRAGKHKDTDISNHRCKASIRTQIKASRLGSVGMRKPAGRRPHIGFPDPLRDRCLALGWDQWQFVKHRRSGPLADKHDPTARGIDRHTFTIARAVGVTKLDGPRWLGSCIEGLASSGQSRLGHDVKGA